LDHPRRIGYLQDPCMISLALPARSRYDVPVPP